MTEQKEKKEYEFEDFGSYMERIEKNRPCLTKLDQSPVNKNILSKWVEKPAHFLVYLGNTGCGKTYFCEALERELIKQDKECVFYSQTNLFKHLKKISQEDFDNEFERIYDSRFLIIDDCFHYMDNWGKEILHDLIDKRSQNEAYPTVITSTQRLDDIEKSFGGMLGRRVCSRLNAKRNTVIESNFVDLRQIYD